MINTKNSEGGTTSIDVTTDVTTLIAEHGRRVALMILNNSEIDMYILIGDNPAEPTAEDYSFKLPANALYEMPYEYYTCQVRGWWASSGDGNAKITQILDK